jgi:hypothetical protein
MSASSEKTIVCEDSSQTHVQSQTEVQDQTESQDQTEIQDGTGSFDWQKHFRSGCSLRLLVIGKRNLRDKFVSS